MKFCIEQVSKSSGRIGQLMINENATYLQTPVLMQTTKGGSIPHLSREVFEYVTKDAQLLQLSLSTMIRMAESVSNFKSKGGLSRFIGFADFPTMMVMHDPCEPFQGGHNDKDIVPIFTRHGKEEITAQRYIELMEKFSPDIYEGLCDADTNYASSKKRIQKSVDRTQQVISKCIELHKSSDKLKRSSIFAPIVGGYSTHARTQSIEHTHREDKDAFGGYILEGFHLYGSDALKVNETALYSIVEHCIKQLNCEKPRFMPGAYTPAVMVELIQLGVDIFDTSYPYYATKNFKALTFCFDILAEYGNGNVPTPFIDISDESYKEDFIPFLPDCACLCCKQHTRAYVHHLCKTRELLGPILLMIHNLHHFMEFFKSIRQCIAIDKLLDLLKLIKYQNGEKPVSYCWQEHINSTSDQDIKARKFENI